MSHPVVTVTVGEHVVLRLDGPHAAITIAPIDDQTRIVAALAQAIDRFLAHQPPVALVVEAVDAVAKLAILPDPAPARAALDRLDPLITAFRTGIAAGAADPTAH